MRLDKKTYLVLAPCLGALIGVLIATPANAQEAEEENTATRLANAPAVRHRLLLVKKRIEVAPTFEATINADFKNTLGGGIKVEYHLSDMLSFGGVGIFGTSLNTGMVDRIIETLPDNEISPTDPTPTKQEFEQHLNAMPIHGALYVGVTPWYGKLAAFGKAFVNFDFYFQGGVALAQLTNSCSPQVCNDTMPTGGVDPATGENIPPDDDPNNDPPLNDGLRAGIYVGGGIHVFVNQWMAIDLTVRDYIFSDNPSGLDFNADRAVSSDDGIEDSRFLNHLFVGVGISIFLPTKAKRTP